jgi:hypothetical protein
MMEALEESYGGPILGSHTKAAHRVAGLLARDVNWFPAEPWGCWARHQRAGLQFELDPAHLASEREVVLYAALTFVGPVLGSRIRLLVGGSALGDDRSVGSLNAVMAWRLPVAELRRRSQDMADGTLAVDLGFELMDVPPAAIEASLAIDPRELAFGLRSFVLLGAGAMAERLQIAERNGYAIAC